MKTEREDFSDSGLFTMSRLGPEELSREMLEDYLAKGRRLHSAYVCGLFARLWQLLGAVLFFNIGRPPGNRARYADCRPHP